MVGELDGLLTALPLKDGKFSITLKADSEFIVSGIYGGQSAYTTSENITIKYDTVDPDIVATKVTANPQSGTKNYSFSDGSVFPKDSTILYPSFVTKDGLVTFTNVKYYNDHGISDSQKPLGVNIKVSEGTTNIVFKGCAYADASITADTAGVSPASASLKTANDGGDIVFSYDGEATTLSFKIDGGAIYLHGLSFTTTGSAEATPEPITEVDYAVDFMNLSGKSILTSDEIANKTTVSFGLTKDGSRVALGSQDAVWNFENYRYHSEDHGVNPGSVKVYVPGPVKIMVGNCAWGSDVTVTNAEGDYSATANTALDQNCYAGDPSDRVTVLYYTKDEPTTLTISGGSYIPYIAVKTEEAPSVGTVTYAAGETAAEGELPPAENNIVIGEYITIPLNRTLYAEGKTLTGWTDGENVYEPGSQYAVTRSVTLTPVFSDNTQERTGTFSVTYDFQRQNGAPTLSWQGSHNIYVSQAEVNGEVQDIKIDVDTTSGKVANGNWTDWAQMNNGTVFTIPVYGETTVTMGDIYTDTGAYTINGVEKIGDNGFETVSGAQSTQLVIGDGGSYFRSFMVDYNV